MGQVAEGQLSNTQTRALQWMRDVHPLAWVSISWRQVQYMKPLVGRFIERKGHSGNWAVRLLPAALESEAF